MQPVFDFGLEATRWLQTTFPQLRGFFVFISTLGIEEFYLAFFPLIYWSVHKRLGKHLAYVFLVSNLANSFLKHMLRGPRPFWLDDLLGLDDEFGYGVPSGHTQSATVIYFFLAAWIRRRWMWLLAIFMVVAMALSRVYLGVHFVHDVVAGFFVGVLILLAYWIWRQRLMAPFNKRILGFRLMVAVLVPLAAGALYAGLLLLLGAVDTAVSWSDFSEVAERSGIDAMTTAVGALLGMSIGIIWEGSRVRFRVEGLLWQRVARYGLGMVVALGIWAGLDAVFPEDPLWLAIPFRLLRYTLLTLWVSLYAPLIFVRIGLAAADPEPEIDLTL